MLLKNLALIAGQASIGFGLHSHARRAGGPSAVASSSDGKYKLSDYTSPVSGGGNAGGASTWKLTVDDTDAGKRQKVNGFGAAITDATVTNFDKLSSDTRSKLLNDLFSADGLGFSLMRHTIASSDLSANAYSYDDNNGNADTSLSSFNLGDSGKAMAQLISDIKGVQGDLTLLGSVWSPPGWQKLNGVIQGNTNQNNLNHQYADQYAQYFVKYIQAFNNAGANVDAITIQNEPLNSQAGYPTMYVYADESAQLIQNNVGPALKAAGLNTKVWAYDHNTDQPSYPQTVIDGASEYVNTVAWHCYASNNDWGVLSDFHNKNPGVDQVMTECWTSSTTGWNQAADFTMGPLQNWASGAIAWTLGTDSNFGPHIDGGCSTCRGLVTVDGGNYTPQIDYYMMGQFSKFMPKGATILDVSGSYDYGNGNKVEATASENPDGSRTVVIENTFDNEVYLTVTMKSGDEWSGPLYAKSVVTWVLPKSG